MSQATLAPFQVPSQAVSSVLVPPGLHRQGQREDRPYAPGQREKNGCPPSDRCEHAASKKSVAENRMDETWKSSESNRDAARWTADRRTRSDAKPPRDRQRVCMATRTIHWGRD